MEFISEENRKLAKKFALFVIKELKIKKAPKILLQNGKGNLKTTASYDYIGDVKIIRVNCKNRALVDFLRSLAHEMIHHKQYEQGRLDVQPEDIGGEIEDEANAKAGVFMKLFSKENPSIYDI